MSEYPETKFEDIQLMFYKVVDIVKSGRDINMVREFNVLLNMPSHPDQKLSSAACEFVYYILKLLKPRSESYIFALKLLAAKSSCTRHSGIIGIILRIIFEEYGNELAISKSPAASQRVVRSFYIEIVEDILQRNSSMAFVLLTYIKSMNTQDVLNIFGPLIVKVLFEDIHLTDINNFEFWNLINSPETKDLMFNCLFWIKEPNVERFVRVFKLCNSNASSDVTILLLAKSLCSFCAKGLNPLKLWSDLSEHLFSATVDIQSLVFLMLTITLKNCQYNNVQDYLRFCEIMLIKGKIWKEVAIMLKVDLLLYNLKHKCFLEIRKSIADLDILIETALVKLNNMNFPEIPDLGARFVVKRYINLNKSYELLKLIYDLFNYDLIANTWLDAFVEEEAPDVIKCLVLYTLLMYGKTPIKEKVVNVLKRRKQKDVDMLFCQFLHTTDAHIKFQLLELICTCKLTVVQMSALKKLLHAIHTHKENLSLGISPHFYYLRQMYDTLKDVNPQTQKRDFAICQALALNQLLRSRGNILAEEYLPILNQLLNNWLSQNEDKYVFAIVLDLIAFLCTMDVLYIEQLWNEIVEAIDENDCPYLLQRLCRFLGSVPGQVRKRKDKKGLIVKSAKLLWYILCKGNYSSHEAAKALRYYDIEDFDRTFLPCKHNSTVETDEEHLLLRGGVPESCWMEFLMEPPLDFCTTLFSYLIEKKCTSQIDTHRDNYNSLHYALLNFLADVGDELNDLYNSNDMYVKVCLHLLSVKWMYVNMNLEFFYNLFCDAEKECLKNRILSIIITHCNTKSSRDVLDKIIHQRILSPSNLACLCSVLNANLSLKKPYVEYITRCGMASAICGEVDTSIVNTLLAFERNHYFDKFIKRNLRVSLLRIWMNYPINSLQFQNANTVLSHFGQPLISRMPRLTIKKSLCMKYITLYTKTAMQFKQIGLFEMCLMLGEEVESLQSEIIRNLILVLEVIRMSNIKMNRSWLLEFAQSINSKGNDFLYTVFALCIDCFTNTYIMSSKQSLQSAINHLPMAVQVFYQNGRAKNVMDLYRWSETENMNPLLREAFKLSAMALADVIGPVDYISIINI